MAKLLYALKKIVSNSTSSISNSFVCFYMTTTPPDDRASISILVPLRMFMIFQSFTNTQIHFCSVLAMATQMLRNLAMFGESLPELPQKRTVVLKLKYYPHTPADYEPRFFRAASSEAYSKFNSKPKRVLLGGLSSGHHALSLSFTGADWLFEDGIDEETYESNPEEVKTSDDGNSQTPTSMSPNSQDTASTTSERSNIDEENKEVNLRGDFGCHPEVMDENDSGNEDTKKGKRAGMRPPANSQQSGKNYQQRGTRRPPRPQQQKNNRDVDDLESHFGRLNASGSDCKCPVEVHGEERNEAGGEALGRPQHVNVSAECSDLEDIEDTFDDDKTMHEEEDGDDDKTRLDEDEFSEDDEAPTQVAQLPAQRQGEIAVLNYLHGKKSASVSVLSIMVKMDELAVAALLEQLAQRGLVTKKGGGRWSIVDSGSKRGNDDADSIISDSQVSVTSSHDTALSKQSKTKDKQTSKVTSSPLKSSEILKEKHAPSSAPSTATPLKDKAAPKCDMPPPQLPITRKKNSKRTAPESLPENLNDSELRDDFDDLGGMSLSQCSQSSQGLSQSRSKYSVAEIHQSKKRRSGYHR